MGFDESDYRDGGSDRLIDALVAWGDEAAIRDQLDALARRGDAYLHPAAIGGRRSDSE